MSPGQLSFRIPCLQNATLGLLLTTTLETPCLLPEPSTTVHSILSQSIIPPSLLPLSFDLTDKFHMSNISFVAITPLSPASVTILQPAPPFLLSRKPSLIYKTVAITYSMNLSHPTLSDDSNHSSFRHAADLRPLRPPPSLTTHVDNKTYHRFRLFHFHPRLLLTPLAPSRRSAFHTQLSIIFQSSYLPRPKPPSSVPTLPFPLL